MVSLQKGLTEPTRRMLRKVCDVHSVEAFVAYRALVRSVVAVTRSVALHVLNSAKGAVTLRTLMALSAGIVKQTAGIASFALQIVLRAGLCSRLRRRVHGE